MKALEIHSNDNDEVVPGRKFNSFTGEHIEIVSEKKKIKESVHKIADPFEITYLNRGSNDLIKVATVDPSKNKLQGSQGYRDVLQNSADEIAHILNFHNGVPYFRAAYWTEGNMIVSETVEGPTTKKDVLEELSLSTLNLQTVADKNGKIFIKIEVTIDGKPQHVLMEETKYGIFREYLEKRKKKVAEKAGTTHVIFEEKHKDTKETPKNKPAGETLVKAPIIDIVPKIEKKMQSSIEKISSEHVIPQPKVEKAVENISDQVFSPVFASVDTISEQDLKQEGRANFLERFDTQRKRTIAAFMIDSWKRVISSPTNEKKIIALRNIRLDFVQKMRGLFPSIKMKTLEGIVTVQWTKFRNAVVMLAKKFPMLLDARVTSRKATPHTQTNSTAGIRIVNGIVERQQPKKISKNDVIPLHSLPKVEVPPTQKIVPSTTVKQAAFSEKIIDINQWKAEKEKTALPETKGKVVNFMEKAKGLFGKVSSLFKRSA